MMYIRRFFIVLLCTPIVVTSALAFGTDKITRNVAPNSKVSIQIYLLYDIIPCRTKPAPAIDPRTPELGKVSSMIVKQKLANGPCGANYDYNALAVTYESGSRTGVDKFILYVSNGYSFTPVPIEINVLAGTKSAATAKSVAVGQPRLATQKSKVSAAQEIRKLEADNSELPTNKRKVSVLSGKSIVAGFSYHLNNDCSSAGPIEFKILEAPKHGGLRIVNELGFSAYGKNDKRLVCNEKPSEITRIYYDAPQSVGSDHFVAQAFFINGNSRKFDVSVDIK